MTDVDFLMREAGCPLKPPQTARVKMSTKQPTEPTRANMSLGDIYEQNAEIVWRFLIHMGLSEADAEDVAQDVFIAVQRSLSGFEGRCTIRTWILRICVSCTRDHRGRAHRRREISNDEWVAQQVDPSSDVAGAIELRQKQALLQRVLDGIDVEKREVFVLVELEEMSAPEIAEALGIPLGTVYSRLRAAREEFKEALARLAAKKHRLGWST